MLDDEVQYSFHRVGTSCYPSHAREMFLVDEDIQCLKDWQVLYSAHNITESLWTEETINPSKIKQISKSFMIVAKKNRETKFPNEKSRFLFQSMLHQIETIIREKCNTSYYYLSMLMQCTSVIMKIIYCI